MTSKRMIWISLPVAVATSAGCTPKLTEAQARDLLLNDGAIAADMFFQRPTCVVDGTPNGANDMLVPNECADDVAKAKIDKARPMCVGDHCWVTAQCGDVKLEVTSIKQEGKTAVVSYAIKAVLPKVSETCVKPKGREGTTGTKSFDWINDKWL